MQKTPGSEEMTFDEWLLYGYTRSWCSAPICNTHDGYATTEEEKTSEACTHYMRVYSNQDQSNKTMSEFPPAYWRAQTRGLKWKD